MKIEFLKTQLKNISSGIGEIFFEVPNIAAMDPEKIYPYILWDLRSLKSRLGWQNSAQVIETITMKAFILGSYDRRAQNNAKTIETKWDELRTAFRAYLTVLNATEYIKITNLNDMPNELFDIGLTLDSEVGVSFDVDMTLYCNQ